MFSRVSMAVGGAVSRPVQSSLRRRGRSVKTSGQVEEFCKQTAFQWRPRHAAAPTTRSWLLRSCRWSAAAARWRRTGKPRPCFCVGSAGILWETLCPGLGATRSSTRSSCPVSTGQYSPVQWPLQLRLDTPQCGFPP